MSLSDFAAEKSERQLFKIDHQYLRYEVHLLDVNSLKEITILAELLLVYGHDSRCEDYDRR